MFRFLVIKEGIYTSELVGYNIGTILNSKYLLKNRDNYLVKPKD